MKIIFLGTSSTFPTKDRSHTAVLLRYSSEALLFDCGEGVQRQMRIAGESPMKITKIFLTHWHGDHVLGLPGLLESFAMNNRQKVLEIFGPAKTREYLHYLLKGFSIGLKFKIIVHELTPSKIATVCKGEGYQVLAMKVKHRVPTLAYSFKENNRYKIKKDFVKKHNLQSNPILTKLQKGLDITVKGKKFKVKDVTFISPGKKVTYAVDSEAIPAIAELAKDSDVFICEGTFSNKLRDMCIERGHMTVKQAAKLAKKAKVKELILTHFSQRYKNTKELETEAKSIFKNVKMARDFLTVNV